jgi:biotin carboxyl carrier protein
MKYIAIVEGQSYEIEINEAGEILADGVHLPADFMAVAEQSVYSLIFENRSYEGHISPSSQGYEVLLRGKRYTINVEDERARLLRQVGGGQAAAGGEFQLKSPMPGLVIDIPVEEGEEVAKGDNLIILESMKMQNELKAPRDGTVVRINAQPGDSVQQDSILIVLD